MKGSSTRGFTLVELIISVAVIAIIVAIAVPSFRDFVANARLSDETNRLVGDLNYARSEAVKRRQTVILCRSADPGASTPSCGGTANDWSTGWLIFSDGNSNGTFQAANDTLLRIGQAAAGGINVSANTTADTSVSYDADGRLSIAIGSTAVFAVCDDREGNGDLDESYGREISVQPIGTIRTSGGSGTSISACNPT